MNFAREQSLLRQRLQAKASPATAEALRQRHGTALVFLGAADPDIAAAAADLVAAHPQMGRAQMTAFVRTLWSSKIHELRAVGAQLLAARSALLEPHDLPLLEGFLGDEAADPVLATLARDVLGALVHKHKKLWRDLKRYVGGAHGGLKRAALRAALPAVQAEAEAFPRFVELAEVVIADPDPVLQAALDQTLAAAAELSRPEAQQFVARHARSVVLPVARPAAPTPAPAATPRTESATAPAPAPADKAAATKKPSRQVAAGDTPAPRAAGTKPATKAAAAPKPKTAKAAPTKAKASAGKTKASASKKTKG
ncbi:MAG: DNA alkylation repair protein [Planctomycetes bacterium]|nr:DNA alkylation repair protein [Planctomycetota bacterium]